MSNPKQEELITNHIPNILWDDPLEWLNSLYPLWTFDSATNTRLLGASHVLKTTQIEWFTHPRNHQLCPLWTKPFFGGEGCLTQLLYHIFGTQPTSGPGILGGASASVWPHHVVGANAQWTWAPKPHRVEGISRRPKVGYLCTHQISHS